MFEIDHLMVEVDDPLKTANEVAERLALPIAWPLMEKDEYTSIGVNFGDINIEFIKFKVRFGIEGTTFRGFSGIAFKPIDSLEASIKQLAAAKIHFRIGEECKAHTTLIIEENNVFPTVFLVEYHFDTSGWIERLKREFFQCAGGKFHIGRFKLLSINQRTPANMTDEFQINHGDKNRIIFESRTGENTVIYDLIEDLEIVIA